jgi:nucleoid-associated protein YgaU
VAVIGVIALAAAGIYLYRHHGPAPSVEETVATGEKPAPEPQKPAESKPAESAPSKPTSVPSFDVVRIEPTGEGVMAGRAEPGWTINIESEGSKIAETKVDEEGAWSVVLDKPLASGDHSLTLRATSPDGTQALTAQAPEQVAVAQKEPSAPEAPKQEATPPATPEEPKAGEATPGAPKPEQRAEAPQGVEGQPEPVVPDENAPPPERPKPPVRISNLEYQDTGAGSGKISISGVGNPNIKVFLFFDQQPLSQVTIGGDGTWAIEIEKKLGEGEHTIRADTYDDKTGMVAGRASVRLAREPQAAEQQAAAPQGTGQAPASEATPAPEATPAEPAVAEGGTSGQPEPVYPEGQRGEAASPEPSASAANAEPPSLSSQRLPVSPAEEAMPEIAKEEPSPAELAQPEVAKQQPAAPKAEQAQPAPPPVPLKSAVVFKSVDYQDTSAETGKVALAGTGEPGAHILLFFDEAPLGEVVVEDDGTWVFAAEKKLETGEHKFRADRVEGGVVVGSASIGLVRMEQPKAPPKEEVAAETPPPAPATGLESTPKAAATPPQPESQVAAAKEAKPASTGKKQAHHKRHRPKVYTVRRGDTLWEIAESYYGGGWHYRAIVRDNKRNIKNPHWIYPKQKFHIPRR